jgi:hypothetical protein
MQCIFRALSSAPRLLECLLQICSWDEGGRPVPLCLTGRRPCGAVDLGGQHACIGPPLLGCGMLVGPRGDRCHGLSAAPRRRCGTIRCLPLHPVGGGRAEVGGMCHPLPVGLEPAMLKTGGGHGHRMVHPSQLIGCLPPACSAGDVQRDDMPQVAPSWRASVHPQIGSCTECTRRVRLVRSKHNSVTRER